jgi:hypothetical protein
MDEQPKHPNCSCDPESPYLCDFCVEKAYDAEVFARVAAQGTMRGMTSSDPAPPKTGLNLTKRR